MQCGHCAPRDRTKQREREKVDVKMKDIEIVGQLPHTVEHEHVVGNRVVNLLVEPQRHRRARNEISGR